MHLVLSIKYQGENKSISLDGGMSSPRRVNGSFSTSDAKLQEAIERHPDFGKSFELVRVIQMEPTAPAGEPEKPEPKPDVYISDAKNAQQAREELNKKFNIPYNSIKNAKSVLEQADKLNIQYPQWERE